MKSTGKHKKHIFWTKSQEDKILNHVAHQRYSTPAISLSRALKLAQEAILEPEYHKAIYSIVPFGWLQTHLPGELEKIKLEDEITKSSTQQQVKEIEPEPKSIPFNSRIPYCQK